MPFTNANQNGASLNMSVQLPEGEGVVIIGGYGSTMTLGVNRRTFRGACVFVPGNYVLGHVTESDLSVRAEPSDAAPTVTVAKRRSLVWSGGRYDEETRAMRGTTDWSQFRVVLTIRGGAVGGGDQMIGMGSTSGLDGRSTVMNGWGLLAGVVLLPTPLR